MSINSENNKRIAKNTMLLYIRMLFTMGVALYTSRVVLNVLGIEDFGIYNVVGGIVIMFAYFNSSLTTATQRFINYEMGKGNNENLKTVFSTALNGHYIMAFLILIIGETVGLWFIKTQLVIPPDRLHAALWVYQYSLFAFIITVISTPYNATIIAHERMNIFAYISILEVTLKLITVFLLVQLSFDKLVLYGFLLFIVSIIIRIVYTIYCKRNFTECHYKFTWDKNLFSRMFSFSGWMFTGTTTSMLSNQGVNMLINIFFGPIQNAARGIAFQVQGAVSAFVENFMMAVQPQIIKSYSQRNMEYMYQLVFGSSKYSFFLLYLLSLPVLMQTDYLLHLWLKNVPEYAVLFTQLTLVDLLINISFKPIATVSFASGKIRNYQLIISLGFLLIFLLTYLFFKWGFPSFVTFVISIILSFIGLLARLCELKYSVNFPIKQYLVKVFWPQSKTVLLSIIIPLLYIHYTSFSFIQFACTIFLTTSSILISIWICGLNRQEKQFIKNKINHYIRK